MEKNLASQLKELFGRIDALKAKIDALRPLSQEQEGRIMQKFSLDWNYHSNAMEGNSLNYGETIAFIMERLTAKGKPFKDHLDIKGHNEGIDYLLDIIKNRAQLNEKTIRELHKMILVEPYSNPAKTLAGQIVEKRVVLGAYKTMSNNVETPTGQIHFFASPEETPAKMADLLAWLLQHQEKGDLHPLILAASFHHRFVDIHPFDDGNGRMCRLLMNLILMQYGYPPVVIKQQDRQAYYYALRQADTGDIGSFVEYIGENLLHSLEIQYKGAQGLSMEEEDDFDKELALLKGSLAKDEAIPKSAEVLYKLLSDTILPLLKAIQSQCRKLDELFFEKWDRAQYAVEGSGYMQAMQSEPWESPNMSWFQAGWSEAPGSNIFKLKYEYHWKEFKRAENPFNISCSMVIDFHRYKYEIGFKGKHFEKHLTNPYSQNLSDSEFSEFSKTFVKEALAEIKFHTNPK